MRDKKYTDLETEEVIFGIEISPKNLSTLKGKILIPNTINGQKVIGLAANAFAGENLSTPSNITHIFFQKDENNTHPLRFIGEYSCRWTQIRYFEFTSNLREIKNYAFHQNKLQINCDLRTSPNLYRIGQNAFRGSFESNIKENLQIYIPSSVKIIEEDAFSFPEVENGAYHVELHIGELDNKSILDLTYTNKATDGFSIMRTNDDSESSIYFYSNKYKSFTEEFYDNQTKQNYPVYQGLKNKALYDKPTIYFTGSNGDQEDDE